MLKVRGLRISEKTTRCAVALDQGLRMQQAAATRFSFFVECLRHSIKVDIFSMLGKQFIGKDFFVECTLSDTRQSLCQVLI